MFASSMGLTACHKNRISNTANQAVVETIVVAPDPTLKDSVVVAEVVEPLKINEVSFQYLTAKSKFSFDGKKQNFDNTNINIRMKKDSLIWISVTGIGFEVARGLITPDSIVLMDKFHKQYYVFSYEELSRKYNFTLSFPLLQSIIIGNLPYPRQVTDHYTRENDFFVLSQTAGRVEINNKIATDNFKLLNINATEIGKDNSFTLQYSDFRNVSDVLFPFISQVALKMKSLQDQENSETKISLKHSRVELVTESPGFPFSIPSGYTRKM